MNILRTIDFTKDFDRLVDILNQKNGHVLTQHEYEEILYQLKTVYYEDELLENLLCTLTKSIQWKVPDSTTALVEIFQQNKNAHGDEYPLLDSNFANFLKQNATKIDAIKDTVSRSVIPFATSIFGLETLQNKYLLRERSTYLQEDLLYLWLRVSLFMNENGEDTDWSRVQQVAEHLTAGLYIHATPTLFNSGTKNPQLASCFAAGTPVLTISGFQKIEDVTEDSLVWTHAQEWRPVIQCHINELGSRKMYEIQFSNFDDTFLVTEDHPFLVLRNDKYEWTPIMDCTLDDVFYSSSMGFAEDETLRMHHQWNGLLYCAEHIKDYHVLRVKIRNVPFVEAVLKEFAIEIMESWRGYRFHVYHLKDDNLPKPEKLLQSYYEAGPGQCASFLEGMEMMYFGEACSPTIHVRPADFYIVQGMLRKLDWKILHFQNKNHLFIAIQIQKSHHGLQSSICCWGGTQVSHRAELGVTKLLKKVMQPTMDPETKVYTLGVKEFHSYTVGNTIAKNCYLTGVDDSLDSIFQSVKECAKISKFAGGIGLHVHNIRASNSYIHGTNGNSNGIVPMLRVYNNTARYIDQGGGKRNGAFAIYLEVWHSDILDFLQLRKNVGSEELRARDLFYALWMNDLFMTAVEKNREWYLFSPSDCPDLANLWGDAFEQQYKKMVRQKRYTKKISAQELWKEIARIQIETGTPYILFKDTCNRLSNQQNLGTIRSSNLCCEIIQYSDFQEYAVCNLASIALPKFLKRNPRISEVEHVIVYGKAHCFFCKLTKYILRKEGVLFHYIDRMEIKTKEEEENIVLKTFPNIYVKMRSKDDKEFVGGFEDLWKNYIRPSFDFEKLGNIVQELVVNLNQVIDKNMYPLEKCKKSNLRHRPMGIGVQGLADLFMELLLPYDSEGARRLNQEIFETIYYHALQQSCIMAEELGTYESYQGSPLSKGKFHFELYPDAAQWKEKYTFRQPWETLRHRIAEHGVRNSLFVAPMPTASTSQILNNTESFEPLTSNFYTRRTQNGEYYIMNRILQRILKGTELWNKEMHELLIFHKGSIQNIQGIPRFLKDIFRTVWEIPQKHCIDMASERQRFIDQSQSMNIYLTNPSIDILTKIIFYGWKKQLKTGCYYVRTRAMTTSQNFYLDAQQEEKFKTCESCSG